MSRLLSLLALLFGCSGAAEVEAPPAEAPQTPAAPITVLAASSLTEALQAVNQSWTEQGHPAAQLSFDASSKLAKQVELGAAADLFFSADQAWMDYLAERSLIDPASRRMLLGNSLVAITAQSSPLTLASPADMAQEGIKRLALAGENVPAGKYGRAALQAAGTWDAVSARVVNGDNVRSVLGWVAAGEADAGVVYATDARIEPRVKVVFEFPEGSYPKIEYPVAVLKGSADPSQAQAFLDFCSSPAGRAHFEAAGFRVP